MQRTAEPAGPVTEPRSCACCGAPAVRSIEVTLMGMPTLIEVCAADLFLEGAHMTAIPLYAPAAQAIAQPEPTR
jgi:hypothetical protein